MKWVTERLGARAVIAAGMDIKDQLREAIQLLSSTQMVERTVYTHTGWLRLEADWRHRRNRSGVVGCRASIKGQEALGSSRHLRRTAGGSASGGRRVGAIRCGKNQPNRSMCEERPARFSRRGRVRLLNGPH
jgi:hypothetical protein